MKANCVIPILQVADLHKAIAFYTESLGFKEDFIYGEPAYYAGVRKNDISIHLNTIAENKDRTGLGSVFILCDEVDLYYEEVKRLGATVTSKPASYPYGVRDFSVKDLDGNLLCFGCPLE